MEWSKGLDERYRYLREYHFIRVHENQVQHPSNNISTIFVDFFCCKVCLVIKCLN